MATKYYVSPAGSYLDPYGAFDDGHADIPGDAVEVASPPPLNATQVWGFPNWGPVVSTNTMVVDERKSDKDSGVISEEVATALDSTAAEEQYSKVKTTIVDNTDGSEDAKYSIETMQAGTLVEVASFEKGITLNGASGGDQGAGSVNAAAMHINGGTAIEDGANKGLKASNKNEYNSPGDFTPGATTVLTMPAASEGDNKDNVIVKFHGLEQEAGSWGISSTTLTFTTPIPAYVTKITIQVLT